MTVRRNLAERVVEACDDARRVIPLDADAVRNGVRRLEADARHLGGEAVRLVLEHVDGERAVLLEDARGERAGEAVVLEPEHEVTELGVRLIRRHDLLDRLFADTGNFLQPVRALLDDLERLVAKRAHDAPRELRSEAVDDARAEEALDALGARRRTDFHVRRLELLAEARMRDPAPAELDLLPDERRRARQRHVHAPTLLEWLQPQHGKAAILGREDDAVDDARELLERIVKSR